jgi:hypothetical protein
MVLKLRDICLACIAKEFYKIENFNSSLLHAAHKELIIELLANHGLLLERRSTQTAAAAANTDTNDNTDGSDAYQQALIEYFFDGHLNTLKFNYCEQLSDKFLARVAIQASSSSSSSSLASRFDQKKLTVNCLKIVGCKNITGK